MIIAFSIIYLVSVIAFYKMIQKQHSRGGRFSGIDPTLVDMFFMFIPMFNTISILMYLVADIKLNTAKFFRVKK